jgi:hypothetical protein
MASQKIYKEMEEIDNKIMKLQNDKPKNFKEKYYICPSCGELSTLSQQIEACSGGGMPYCYCKYGGERGRVFVGYKRINKKLWEELKELKTDKLRLRKYLQYKISRIKRRIKR